MVLLRGNYIFRYQKMYFLEQIKKQFIAQLASHNNWPEGPSDADTPPAVEWPKSPDDVRRDMEATGEEAHRTAEGMEARSNELAEWVAALEWGKDIEPLSTAETLSHMQTRPEEEASAREALWENATPEQIRAHAFDARVEALQSNTITQWEREVIEAEFIAEIAAESDISPELIWDLRALWFEGSQDWAEGDVAANLESMTEDLQRMKEQIEADGGEFPKTKEEFMALYEAMNQNDGIADQEPMSPEEAAAAWVDVVDSGDGIWIDPNGEWVQTVWDTVIAPNGSYSRWWNVYPAQRIQWSGPDVPPSSVTEWVTRIDPNNNSSPELEAYTNEHNKEIIKKMVPAEWHGAAIEMAKKVWDLQEGKVIALASMWEWENSRGPEGIVCYPEPAWEVHTFPIIVWRNGYAEGVSSWDKKTPVNTLFNFNSGKVAGRWNDASQWGSSTVLWGAAYSPEAAALGGRWWHGVADHRIPGGRTHGCIGAKQENMIALASAINRHGGWYGMNLVSKQG